MQRRFNQIHAEAQKVGRGDLVGLGQRDRRKYPAAAQTFGDARRLRRIEPLASRQARDFLNPADRHPYGTLHRQIAKPQHRTGGQLHGGSQGRCAMIRRQGLPRHPDLGVALRAPAVHARQNCGFDHPRSCDPTRRKRLWQHGFRRERGHFCL